MAWRVRMRYGGYNDRLLGEVARKRREAKLYAKSAKNILVHFACLPDGGFTCRMEGGLCVKLWILGQL